MKNTTPIWKTPQEEMPTPNADIIWYDDSSDCFHIGSCKLDRRRHREGYYRWESYGGDDWCSYTEEIVYWAYLSKSIFD